MDNFIPEIAVDFDGTLAYYDHFRGHGVEVLGTPIEPMLNRVKYWVSSGQTVVIFTARATADEEGHYAKAQIREWLEKHGVTKTLEITNIKKKSFKVFYDDRAFHVIPNTGQVIGVLD